MKKVKHVSGKVLSGRSEGRFLRRFIRKLFGSVVKRQDYDWKGEIKKLRKELKEVEERIELVAGERVRQEKRSRR